jgi:predicted nucleotidyltransferase component of viral defense system
VPLLRDAPDDLFALVGEASERLGLPLEFVEKDFWITELLRSVASPIEHAFVIFKGGTSLSKAFGIIQRFSEDVDILLVPDAELGKGRVDRILKAICTRAGKALGAGERDQQHEGATTGIRRAVRYAYPARVDAAIVRPGVLLEMGVRGGPEPRETRPVQSFIAQHATENLGLSDKEYDEFAPVHLEVLSPERTLVEKLALLHHLGTTFPQSEEKLRRSGRHIYDVYQLLHHPSTAGKLEAAPKLAADISRDIETHSSRWGWESSPRPPDGYTRSPVFDPTHSCFETVQAAYEAATSLIYGQVTSLEECRNAILEHANVL